MSNHLDLALALKLSDFVPIDQACHVVTAETYRAANIRLDFMLLALKAHYYICSGFAKANILLRSFFFDDYLICKSPLISPISKWVSSCTFFDKTSRISLTSQFPHHTVKDASINLM
jgi:hypothetical protein